MVYFHCQPDLHLHNLANFYFSLLHFRFSQLKWWWQQQPNGNIAKDKTGQNSAANSSQVQMSQLSLNQYLKERLADRNEITKGIKSRARQGIGPFSFQPLLDRPIPTSLARSFHPSREQMKKIHKTKLQREEEEAEWIASCITHYTMMKML